MKIESKDTIDLRSPSVAQLIEKLTSYFGFSSIRPRDCKGISMKIKEIAPNDSVSEKTLLRLIGSDKTNSFISLNSLNCLARFLGYNSFKHFTENYQVEKGLGKGELTRTQGLVAAMEGVDIFLQIIDVSEVQEVSFEVVGKYCKMYTNNYYFYTTALPQLLERAFKEGNTLFLFRFFDLPDIFKDKSYMHNSLWTLMQHFGLLMRKYPEVRSVLLPVFAQNKLAQSLYFEFFVDTDELVLHHHQAIRYYCEAKRTPEAQLFGHCLLYLHHFLMNDKLGCIKEMKILNAIPKSDSIHVLPMSRWYAMRLLHSHFNSETGISSELWEETLHFANEGNKKHPNWNEKPFWVHIKIIESLIICQRKDLLVVYFDKIILKKYDLSELESEINNITGLILMYYSLYLHYQGNNELAQAYLLKQPKNRVGIFEQQYAEIIQNLVFFTVFEDSIYQEHIKMIAIKLKYHFFVRYFDG
jgi:hypothetical protein